jgi:hypothetical protein
MANDLNIAANGLFVTIPVTVATKDVAYELTLHPQCRRLVVEPKTNDGSFAYSGTKGADLATAAYALTADFSQEFTTPEGSTPVYLQVDVNATVVAITQLPE